MKTTLDELIEQIDNEVNFLSSLHGKEIFGRKIGLAFAKRVALEFKEKEKEQIKDAWDSAYGGDSFYSGESYYIGTFKQQEQ